MCGLVGFFEQASGMSSEQYRLISMRMSAAIRHRGPDDDDVWHNADAGIALGHRRLSIIDLSAHGRQPMASESGRYVIAYNGEVYNFPALRKELEPLGHAFRGHSDTEVILAAIEEWGLESTLGRLVGMFAFALWDRTTRQLSLVRDRLGIKPLYYGWSGQTFLFASELRAIEQHPHFNADVDKEALSLISEIQLCAGALVNAEGHPQIDARDDSDDERDQGKRAYNDLLVPARRGTTGY